MKYNYINRWSYLFRDQKNSFALAPVASFVYDGYLLIEEHQFQPGPYGYDRTFGYLWDPIAGMASRPLMMLDYQNNSFFYTHDANKNITELVDDSGKIVTHYEYSPFGALTVSTASTANPFTFSSEYFDSSLGLIYYNYRHYNPLDGRWLSRDPIEEKGGWNLYGMVNNNIINSWDEKGLWAINIGITLNLSIFGGGSVSVGVAVGYSRKDGVTIGGYVNEGVGAGGVSGSAGVSVGFSPYTDSVEDLAGVSLGSSVSGGEALVIGAGISMPYSSDDICSGKLTYNLFVGVGGGLPFDAQVLPASVTWAFDFCLINGETVSGSGSLSMDIPVPSPVIKEKYL